MAWVSSLNPTLRLFVTVKIVTVSEPSNDDEAAKLGSGQVAKLKTMLIQLRCVKDLISFLNVKWVYFTVSMVFCVFAVMVW